MPLGDDGQMPVAVIKTYDLAGWRRAGSQALRLFRWDFLTRPSPIRRTGRRPKVQGRSCSPGRT